MDIGELRGRIIADRRQFKGEIEATKNDLKGLGKEARATDGQFDALNSTLSKIGVNADQIGKIQREVKNANPQILERNLKDVREQLKLLGVDSKQINKIEKELREASNEAVNVKNSLGGIGELLGTLGAAAVLYNIKNVIAETTREATKLTNALIGLDSMAKAFGESTESARKSAKGLAEDGLAPISVYASGLKSLLASGLGLEEANEMMDVFKDRAAFGRASTISFSQAVENLAQAFKTEQSELGDLSGMTENFSMILEVGAQQLGKNVNHLTQAERAQAKYLGILQLSQPFIGDAAKMTDTFSGRQEQLNAKWLEAKQVLGEAYIPVLDEVMEKMTPIIMGVTEWTAENKEMVAGMTAAVTVTTALTAGIGTLAVAFKVLRVSMGWIGVALTLLTTVVAGVVAYIGASNAASESVMKFANSQEELNKKLSESPLNRSIEDVKTLQNDIDVLNGIMEKRNQLLDEEKRRMEDAHNGRGSVANTHELLNISEAIGKLEEKLRDLDYDTPEKAAEALMKMNEQLKLSTPALVEMERAEAKEIATKQDHINKMESLVNRYRKLNDIENLNTAQKQELSSVVNQLIKEYPDLNAMVDEEGRWKLENIGITESLIQAERDHLEEVSKDTRARVELYRKEAEARLLLLKGQRDLNQTFVEKTTKKGLFDKGIFDDSQLPTNLSPSTRSAMISIGQGMADQMKAENKELNKEINQQQLHLNDIKKMKQDMKDGTLFELSTYQNDDLGGSSSRGKSPEEIAQELRQKNFQNEMATIKFKTIMYEWSAQQQIESLEKVKKKHSRHLSETVQDERAIALEIKHLQDDIAAKKVESNEKALKEQFKNSTDWIDQEKYYKRLSLEEELAAWQRIQLRYEKGSEERMKAAREVFRVEQDIQKEREKMLQDHQKEIDQMTSAMIKSIRDLEREELDSIDKRKRGIEDYYDDLERMRDDQEREELRSLDRRKQEILDFYNIENNIQEEKEYSEERKEIVDELEKYRFAVSKKGQDKFRELEERLQQLDLEEKKRNIQIEKDAKLRALDDEKQAIEDHYDSLRRQSEIEREIKLEQLELEKESVEQFYDDLEKAFESYKDGILQIEALMQDGRFNLLKETNQKMLTELQNYVAEYNRIQQSMQNAGSNGVVAQMQANAINWHQSSDAEKARLKAESANLGASIGATRNKDGVWFKNGKRLFHTGGIAGEMNFRNEDMLMPDEIAAIVQRPEIIMQPKQLASLLDKSSGTEGVINNYYAPLTAVNEMNVRDDQDIQLISKDIYNLQENHTRSKGRKVK